MFINRKNKKVHELNDLLKGRPALRVSICTGEKTAGFKDKNTGLIKEVMLIKSDRDLQAFRDRYHITGKIEKVY